ncbi:MAG: TIM barrel protein [Bryobacterales bacterium]|nr:TIM barrel protein [Bryobacterales bacterium]
MERRDLLTLSATTLAAATTLTATGSGKAQPGAAASAAASPAPVKIGVDLFSVRDQGWSDFEMLAYAGRQKLKHAQFSVTRFYSSLAPEHLRKVRERADSLGIQLETGMDSICPTSTRFAKELGKGEKQLLDQLATAKIVGSKIVRCYLGTMADRKTEVPFDKHIEAMLGVLKGVKPQFVDAGVKVSIENHAGDFQARRLRTVIEQAGKDWVGATYDSGNPCWTMEDPLAAAETLAPYVATVHLRDSQVWADEKGLQVQWVRFGRGNMRMAEVVKRLHAANPELVFNLETICIGTRPFPVKDATFWKGYEDIAAQDLMGLYGLAEKANPAPDAPKRSKEETVRAQLEESDDSIAGMRKIVAGLGLKEA